MSQRFLIFIAGLFFPLVLFSQYHRKTVFSISDGLPINEITSVYCDQAGAIWFALNNGDIGKYTGAHLHIIESKKIGLQASNVSFVEDRRGLWINRRGVGSALLVNNRWYSFNEESWSNLFLPKGQQIIRSIDDNLQCWIYDYKANKWILEDSLNFEIPCSKTFTPYFMNLENSDVIVIKTRCDTEPDTLQMTILREWGDTFSIKSASSTQNIFPLDTAKIIIQDENDIDKYYIKEDERITPLIGNSHFEVENHKWPYFLPEYINGDVYIYRYIDETNRALGNLCEVFKISPEGDLELQVRFRHNAVAQNFTIDQIGHFWFATQGGLVKVEPDVLVLHESNPNMITQLHTIAEDCDGHIWFGSYREGLARFDGESIERPDNKASIYNRLLPGSFSSDSCLLMLFDEQYGLIFKDGPVEWQHFGRKDNCKGTFCYTGYFFQQISNNRLAVGLSKAGMAITEMPVKMDSDWNYIDEAKGNRLPNVLTIAEDDSFRIWMGRTSSGLSCYDPVRDTAVTWLRDPKHPNSYGSMSSLIDSKGNLWMGSDRGLHFIERPYLIDIYSENIFELSEFVPAEELGTATVTSLIEHEGYLLIGNTRGIGFLDINRFYDNDEVVVYFTPISPREGPVEQNAMMFDSKNNLWIGQDFAASRISWNEIKFDTNKVSIVVDSVISGNKNLLLESGRLTLPKMHRNIELHVSSTMTNFLLNNVGYKYRSLHPKIQDTTWSQLDKTGILYFRYLPPGLNTIEIQAIKNNMVHDQISLQFRVPRAISESPFFWVSLLGFLGVTIGLIIRIRYKKNLEVQRKEIALSESKRLLALKELKISEQQTEKERLQIQALANSLNPHFINNTLQWLQSRVRKDPHAVRMIDRFSKNIRTVFLNSRSGKAFHLLSEELNLVKNYLYIQESRFGEPIEVSWPEPEIIANLDNFEVPLMQIQIHVENAVEHGLRHSDRERELAIVIESKGDFVTIRILDNGIGRTESRKIQTQGTQQGVSMLRNLHDIFNSHNSKKISTDYIDGIYTDINTGEKYGTEVIVSIPLIYTYVN